MMNFNFDIFPFCIWLFYMLDVVFSNKTRCFRLSRLYYYNCYCFKFHHHVVGSLFICTEEVFKLRCKEKYVLNVVNFLADMYMLYTCTIHFSLGESIPRCCDNHVEQNGTCVGKEVSPQIYKVFLKILFKL